MSDYDDYDVEIQTPVIVTFVDLETGAIASHPHNHTVWWWSEGNGGCDCNRDDAFPGGFEERDVPCSHRRYIAIGVEPEGDKDDQWKAWALENINDTHMRDHEVRAAFARWESQR